MITGATRLTGVIGWPVAHSRSPAMHNAAFAALGLDWVYVPLPVPLERIGEAVRGLPALGFAGANVTVPHKQAVIPCLEELTPVAKAVGAVNTIAVRGDGSLTGDSTDGPGFLSDLREHGVAPQRALVVGAGGAARSVVYALADGGAEVAVAARSVQKAAELCEALAAAQPAFRSTPSRRLWGNWLKYRTSSSMPRACVCTTAMRSLGTLQFPSDPTTLSTTLSTTAARPCSTWRQRTARLQSTALGCSCTRARCRSSGGRGCRRRSM